MAESPGRNRPADPSEAARRRAERPAPAHAEAAAAAAADDHLVDFSHDGASRDAGDAPVDFGSPPDGPGAVTQGHGGIRDRKEADFRLDRTDDASPYEVDLRGEPLPAGSGGPGLRPHPRPGPRPRTQVASRPVREAGPPPSAEAATEQRLQARGIDPPSRRLERDLPCVICGHNLRGQHRGGKCPECGHPVRESIGGLSHLMDAPESYLRSLRVGAMLLGGASILMVVSVVTPALLPLVPIARIAMAGLGMFSAVLWIWGVWVVTQRAPGEPASDLGRWGSVRTLCRFAVVGGALGSVMISLIDEILPSANWPNAIQSLLTLAAIGALLLLAAAIWLTCQRLGDLSNWFQDTDTAGSFDAALTGASIAILLMIMGQFFMFFGFFALAAWLYTAFNYLRGTLTFMATVQAAVRDKPLHEARRKRHAEQPLR